MDADAGYFYPNHLIIERKKTIYRKASYLRFQIDALPNNWT